MFMDLSTSLGSKGYCLDVDNVAYGTFVYGETSFYPAYLLFI
jgi:hypothetical protein